MLFLSVQMSFGRMFKENQISEASIILCQTRNTRWLEFKQKSVRSRIWNDKAFDRAQKRVWLPICTSQITKEISCFLLCSGASYPPGYPLLLTTSILTSPWLRGWGRELITGRVFMSNSTSVMLMPDCAVSHLCTFSLPRLILPPISSGPFNEKIFTHFKILFKYQLFQEAFYDFLQAGLWVFPLCN